MLKPHTDGHDDPRQPKNFVARFSTAFNTGFEALTGKYKRAVHFLTVRTWLTVGIVAVFGGSLYWLMSTTPSSFVPNEDQGTIFALISLPPASSMERTAAITDQVDSIAHTIPAVDNTLRILGQNFIAGSGSAYSMVIIETKLWDERPDAPVSRIIGDIMAKTSGIRGASIFCISPPTVSGFGTSGGFEFQIQDKSGGTSDQLYKVSQTFLAALAKRPEIQYATTAFNPNFPQYQLEVNVAKCKEAGVTVNAVLGAMQGYYGGLYASNFNQFGKQYRVMVQADYRYRASEQGLSEIYVRTATNAMAPISEFVSLTRVYGPESVSRFNLFSSAAVTGAPNTGFSSGDAITAISEVAAQTLPVGYGYEFSGSASWEVDVWGKLRSTKRAYLASLLQSEAYKRAVQTQLIADIATNYYTLLAYDRQLAITEQTLKNRLADVETMKALKQADVVTGADVVQSETNRYSAEVAIPDLKRSIRETENALSILLSTEPDSIQRTRLDEQQPVTSLQTGLPAQLLANRPDVQQAELSFRNAFELTNVARTYFYPSLTITGSAGWATANTLKGFFDGTFYGSLVAGLTHPIFNKGLNTQRLRTAENTQAEAFYTFQSTVLTAGQEVSNALYAYQMAVEKSGSRQLQLQSLEKAVDFTKELLKYTTSTNYNDVLTSEQNLLTAQIS